MALDDLGITDHKLEIQEVDVDHVGEEMATKVRRMQCQKKYKILQESPGISDYIANVNRQPLFTVSHIRDSCFRYAAQHNMSFMRHSHQTVDKLQCVRYVCSWFSRTFCPFYLLFRMKRGEN